MGRGSHHRRTASDDATYETDEARERAAQKRKTTTTIKELEASKQSLIGARQCVLSDISHPEAVQRSIIWHESKIAWHQQQIMNAKRSLEHGHERIDEYDARIIAVNQKIARLKNQDKVDELLRLNSLVKELEAEPLDAEFEGPAPTDLQPGDDFYGEAFDGEPEAGELQQFAHEGS